MAYQRPFRWIELLDDLTSVEFLLSVTFAGREFYFSTRPQNISGIPFAGGLSADWTDALDLFNHSPTLLSIPLTLIFPEDVAALVAKGHDLWRGTGELSLWVEGRPYEDRIVLITGDMVDPSYGAAGEPVKFSLEANGFQDSRLTHTQTQKILPLVTWAGTMPESSENKVYPIVFGTPGVYSSSDGSAAVTPGSPAYVVDVPALFPPKALIAGHEVAASSITLFNEETGISAVATVETETDLLGQTVSTVEFPPVAVFPYDSGDPIFVVWDQGGGGLWNDTRTAARTGAGELITYLLRLTTLKTDAGTWRALGPALDSFKLAGYIDDAVSAWEYIEDNILPLLPLSVFATGEGISAVLWRREATKDEAVGTITTGGGVARVGPVEYEKQTLYNDIRIDYAKDAESGDYLRSSGVVGSRKPGTDEPDLFSTSFSRASFLRYGEKARSLDTDIIYETATATNVLQWMHRAAAFPYRVILYDVPVRLGFLRRGDLVLLTDPEIHLFGYLAFVRDIAWIDGRPRLSLVLVDDPPRENRLK